tara:strand:+ start:2641 stop:3273 length:633 start_codon:yes stop_codon:yes gene_type:complete
MKENSIHINYIFQEDLLKKLDEQIPSNIREKYPFIFRRSGYARFDNNELNSIYIGLKGKSFNLDVVKFNYENNEFIFKYLYLYYEPSEEEKKFILEKYDIPDGRYTYRIDSDMNKESSYIHHRTLIEDNQIWFNTKFKEKNIVDKRYVYDGLKPIVDCPEYLNILMKENIIEKIQKHDKSWFFSKKEHENSIYLAVGDYKAMLNGEPYSE